MKRFSAEPRFFRHEQIGSLLLLKVLQVRKTSEVWCGADLETGELSAVKFFYPEQCNEVHFQVSSHFLLNVDSPAIIRVFQAGKTVNGFPYIIMEYASQGSLRSLLKRNGRISFAQSVYLMHQMLNALCVLYENSVVHRDIKPENIWITGAGMLRLGDFGIARFPSVAEKNGKVFGSARYCSPEQALDSTKADFRSDLYSLGAVVFEALTGKPLRQEDSFIAGSCCVPEQLELLYEFSTPGFSGLIGELLEHSPADRPDSPGSILKKLKDLNLPESLLLPQR